MTPDSGPPNPWPHALKHSIDHLTVLVCSLFPVFLCAVGNVSSSGGKYRPDTTQVQLSSI